MDIKRYKVYHNINDPCLTVADCSDGDWVDYSDAKSLIADLAASERSRADLIKQNQSLAAENERLEGLVLSAETEGSRHFAYQRILARCNKAEAVIKAAQEQEPALRLNSMGGGMQWNPNYKGDWSGEFYAHPVPAQLETPGFERFAMNDRPEMKPAVAVPDGWHIEKFMEATMAGFRIDSPDENHLRLERDGLRPNHHPINMFYDFCKAILSAASHDRRPSHEPVGGNFVSCEYGDVWNSVPYTDGKAHERELSPAEFERQYEQVFHPIHEAYGVQDSGVVDHD